MTDNGTDPENGGATGPVEEPGTPDPAGQEPDPAGQEPDPAGRETFGRPYVEQLRTESKRYRQRASDAEQRADNLAAELWRARVAATGRLADPGDLPYDAEALDDAGALDAAITALLDRKPHLARRRVSGDVGQHDTPDGERVSLGTLLRANA